MAEYANLSPEAVKLVEGLETELKAQGSDVVLLAYAKYAELDEETIKLIQDLEAKNNVVLIAYDK